MDKLKEQLAPVQKHLFWIGCGLIVMVTLYSWYSSTSHLRAEHEKLKSEIDNSFQTVSSIKPNHPNDQTSKGMQALINETGEKVAARWAVLAKNQEKVLVWPTRVLDQAFVDQVNTLRPPELTVTDGVNEIGGDHKRVYRDHVIKVFPDLAAIIGATWNGKVSATSGMGGMMGMGGGGPPGGGNMAEAMMSAMTPGQGGGTKTQVEDTSLVQWNPANQSAILSDHFAFTASEAALPSTRQILYAQEDLWVLENLLNIIKATNGDISHRHEAAIKTIDSIQIGRGAVQESGKVSPVGKAAAEGGMESGGPGMGNMMDQMMGSMGGGPGGDGMGSPGGAGSGAAAAPPGGEAEPGGGGPAMTMGGGGGGGAVRATGNPADNRYVDRDYQGVLSSRLVSAMKGQPERPEDLFLAVAKRVPVRMVFKMDQRRVPTLLAECANSKLPVEVKQVRVNREAASGGMGGGGMTGGMLGAGGPGDSPGGMDVSDMMANMGGAFGGGQGAAAANPNRKAIADSTVDPNEIGIEIYGIVYIYNPVNRAVLGLKDEAPATTPVVTPTPTPTPTGTGPATPPANTGAALPTGASGPAVN